jgi:acetyl-CoA acetyltransferase
MSERIAAPSGAQLKRWEKLTMEKYRRRDGLFLAEGGKVVCELLRSGRPVEAILVSEEVVKKLGVSSRAIKIRASVLASGREREWDDIDIAVRASKIAYERAGLGPQDIQVCEVHDATAFGELAQTENLGFFPKGEGGPMAERGETKIGGRIPINPSGGLLSRGHPIGASGSAQIHELVSQLRGEVGKRQVAGARIALAENGGGVIGNEEAAMCIHILSK